MYGLRYRPTQPNMLRVAQPDDEHDAETTFGRAVRSARTTLGWTQEQLRRRLLDAYDIDLSKTAMARLEQGGRPIRLNEVYGLAQVLGIDLSGFGRAPAPAGLADENDFEVDDINVEIAKKWALAMERRAALETEQAGLRAHLEWIRAAEEEAIQHLVDVRDTLATLNTYIHSAFQAAKKGGSPVPTDIQASIDRLLGVPDGDR
jgi:transcriptional regulator with XRE-family HTH domain